MVCFTGIIVCYTVYAYQQENLLADKDKKLDVFLLLAIQAFVAMTLSATIIKGCDMGDITDIRSGDVITGSLLFMSGVSSNYALKFVNFPFMALAKSAKVIPVALTGYIRGVYQLNVMQIFLTFSITAGLIIFNYKKVRGFADESMFGIGLVAFSLVFDGISSSQQDKNHKEHKREWAYLTMFYNNLVIFVLNFACYLYNSVFEGDKSFEIISNSP